MSVESGRLKVTNGAAVAGDGYQIVTTVIGKTYEITANLLDGTAASRLYGGTNVNAFGYFMFDAGYATETAVSTTFLATTTTTYISVSPDSTTSGLNCYADNVSVKQVHSFTDANGPYGYYSEAARENLIQYNEDLTTGWTITNLTKTLNSLVDPSGRKTGIQLSETAPGTVRVSDQATVNATSATLSCYIKKGDFDEESSHLFGMYNVTTATDLGYVYPNYATGTLTNNATAPDSSSITDVGNGWYRLTVTMTTGITSGDVLNFYYGGIGAALGAGTTWNLWLPQGEPAAFASTAIRCPTTAVTRNKDELTYASSGNASYPLTVSCDYTTTSLVLAARTILSIDDGTANERTYQYQTGGGKVGSVAIDGGSTLINIETDAAITVDTPVSITSIFALNDGRLYRDGISQGTPDIGATMPTVTTISVGQNAVAADQPFGSIRHVKIIPRPLSDKEVIAL